MAGAVDGSVAGAVVGEEEDVFADVTQGHTWGLSGHLECTGACCRGATILGNP